MCTSCAETFFHHAQCQGCAQGRNLPGKESWVWLSCRCSLAPERLLQAVNNNGEGKVMRLLLHRTQTSRNINTTGDLTFKKKMHVIRESLHCSPFLDELTTVEWGHAQCMLVRWQQARTFSGLVFFCRAVTHLGKRWRTDIFCTIKTIYENAGLWEKLCALGTDGCTAMRSTPECAGVDAHVTQNVKALLPT